MFKYYSSQVHSLYLNGKGKTKIHRVTVNGTKGTKEVIVKNSSGKILNKTRKALKKKEVNCIRKCKFVPDLFKSCNIMNNRHA
jgi:hypothetical protein